MKDNFSKQSHLYAQYRPHYPEELFSYIVSFVKNKNAAWDCGTGNGQSAAQLAEHFAAVYATDISEKQLQNAAQAANIFYSVQPAEHTSIESNSIGLVTVAQAIHWFDFEKFYAEVKRVATTDGIIAVWCYSLFTISPDIDAVIGKFHYNTLENYWDPERKYVDEGYINIPFPFKKINTPLFHIEKQLAIEEIEGYLNTWSAVQKYITEHSENPVAGLIKQVLPLWGGIKKRTVVFPVHLLLGKIFS